MLRFDGQVALVTGAGRGLGREYALLLGKLGAKVVVNDLGGGVYDVHRGKDKPSEAVAEQVAAEIKQNGGEAIANSDSVLDGDKVVKAALDAFGRVDIVICNAGSAHQHQFRHMELEAWEQQLAVHATGTYSVCKAAWPHMLKQSYGRIVLTSSMAGLYGLPSVSGYCAGKAAVLGLANSLAIESRLFAKGNIKVNVVAPIAATRMTQEPSNGSKPPTRAAAKFQQSFNPALVAPLVAYLSHEQCPESGSVFEAGAGWFAKTRTQRAKGVVLAESGDGLTGMVGQIRDSWSQLSDFSEATSPGPAAFPDSADLFKIVKNGSKL